MTAVDHPTLGECNQVSCLSLGQPSLTLVRRVLKENGFAANYGVEILKRNYGTAFQPQCEEFVFTASFGFYEGRANKLLSANKLWLRHVFARSSMNAGFLDRRESVEYQRFRKLKKELGSDFDVIGTAGWVDGSLPPLPSMIRQPKIGHWLGVSSRSWLAIDLDYWMLYAFDSLFDLLCWRPRDEVVSET